MPKSLVFSACLLISFGPGIIEAWRNAGTFGKPCSNATMGEGSKVVTCDVVSKQYCSPTGRCECDPAPPNRKSVFDTTSSSCVLVPTEEDGWRCLTTEQCQASSLGIMARCNMDMGTCGCDDSAQLQSGTCFSSRSNLDNDNYPSCMNDDDCRRSSFGSLSRCNRIDVKCECFDVVTGGKNTTPLYNGECVYQRPVGGFCEKDAECKASHPNSECKEHSGYLPGEKICVMCENCQDDKNGSPRLFTMSLLTLAVKLFIVTLIFS